MRGCGDSSRNFIPGICYTNFFSIIRAVFRGGAGGGAVVLPRFEDNCH